MQSRARNARASRPRRDRRRWPRRVLRRRSAIVATELTAQVDVFDRLATPWGLVRADVAVALNGFLLYEDIAKPEVFGWVSTSSVITLAATRTIGLAGIRRIARDHGPSRCRCVSRDAGLPPE